MANEFGNRSKNAGTVILRKLIEQKHVGLYYMLEKRVPSVRLGSDGGFSIVDVWEPDDTGLAAMDASQSRMF